MKTEMDGIDRFDSLKLAIAVRELIGLRMMWVGYIRDENSNGLSKLWLRAYLEWVTFFF